ncbi:MAG: Nif3-like dinuclear metal center hexameric protein [Bacteroidota bacterium]
MLKARELFQVLETWAPSDLAESYDNVGLLVGNPDQELTGALVNLDVTEDVINEAIHLGVNCIITHHPIWFKSRKNLTGEDYVSRILIQAVKKDILLFAAHTNLDNVIHGVNQKIGQKLNLQETQFLRTKASPTPSGSGLVGFLPNPLSKQSFLDTVKSTFHCGIVRYADFPGDTIQKVGVCGGAGSFLIPEARKQQVDAFLTADLSYHYFFENEDRFLLCDIGHYESEQFTSELILEFISKKFRKFAIHLSKVRTNPVHYH